MKFSNTSDLDADSKDSAIAHFSVIENEAINLLFKNELISNDMTKYVTPSVIIIHVIDFSHIIQNEFFYYYDGMLFSTYLAYTDKFYDIGDEIEKDRITEEIEECKHKAINKYLDQIGYEEDYNLNHLLDVTKLILTVSYTKKAIVCESRDLQYYDTFAELFNSNYDYLFGNNVEEELCTEYLKIKQAICK